MYGIRWAEFDRNDRVVNKEKLFGTAEARDKFVAKVEQKDNFWQFVAWLDEEPEREEREPCSSRD